MMKKLTLSALAAFAVAGTSFAGPVVVTSKEYKQPCVTPCFRDTEWQLDLFYSYNDASHQGGQNGTDRFTSDPFTTPIANGVFPGSTNLLNNAGAVPPGSTVIRDRKTSGSLPQYFHDGSGGGVGLNYFFAKYFGIGVEGNWWDGCTGGFNGNYRTRDLVDTTTSGVATDVATLLAAAKAAHTSVTLLNIDPATNTTTAYLLKRSAKFGDTHRSAANQVSGSLILRYPFEGPICWAPYIFGGGGGVFDGDSTGFGHVGLGVEFRVTPYMGFFTDWRWEFMSNSGSDNGFQDDPRVRELAKSVGLGKLKDINSNDRNDVNMTRVGVRFVF
ncbi:MAG: hypothetical protein PHQ12_02340 [Chthoniobacteraceae bacterium]|nr:hypothetical protein [Chthoniobacteraceae bacterium]